MSSHHPIVTAGGYPNSQRGVPSTVAVAIIIGLTLSACLADWQAGNATLSSRTDLTPALAPTVPGPKESVDNSRECSIEKSIITACIFV